MSVRQTDGLLQKYNPKQINVETKRVATTYFAEGFWNEDRTFAQERQIALDRHKKMREKGYRIGNVDVTLILQKPKVMDYKPAMKDNIVKLLHTTPNRVNVKARTHEKVDSVGEGKSYACHVVCILERDSS